MGRIKEPQNILDASKRTKKRPDTTTRQNHIMRGIYLAGTDFVCLNSKNNFEMHLNFAG